MFSLICSSYVKGIFCTSAFVASPFQTNVNINYIKFPCSDCSSPTLEQALLLKCANVGSRSNSPADSETSGVSSIDGNFSDLMVCVSVLSDC